MVIKLSGEQIYRGRQLVYKEVAAGGKAQVGAAVKELDVGLGCALQALGAQVKSAAAEALSSTMIQAGGRVHWVSEAMQRRVWAAVL